MDIAKYIGLFLLKNQYCYIHGLGNLELRKISASYDGKALQAPSYEVNVTAGGSIDDNLANFIATTEQISISKAANALREYSIQTRKDISEGKDVVIPGIGRFVEEHGKVKFITDSNFSFTPPGIPTVRNSKQLDEQIARPAHKPSSNVTSGGSSVNWSMIVILLVLLIVLGGGGFGIWYYMNMSKDAPASVAVPKVDTIVKQPAPVPVHVPDTTIAPGDSALPAAAVPPPPVADTPKKVGYKFVIGNYRTKEKADFRIQTLTQNGNKVEIVRKDSMDYLIITSVNCKVTDTAHVIDSLKRMFGYKGTTVYK